jgi:hypothetical protein
MLKFKDFISMSDEQLDEAKFIKVNRIRNGVIQRRHIVSATRGYKIIGGKLVRMTSQEKMHRRIAQRKAAMKRRPKLAVALRRRAKSIKKRFSTGIEHKPPVNQNQHHA